MGGQDKTLGKKRGRPAIGAGVQINAVFRPQTVRTLDSWIAQQPQPKPSRPEAVRRLTERGLGQHLVDENDG